MFFNPFLILKVILKVKNVGSCSEWYNVLFFTVGFIQIGAVYRLMVTVEIPCGMLLDPKVLLKSLNYSQTVSVTPFQMQIKFFPWKCVWMRVLTVRKCNFIYSPSHGKLNPWKKAKINIHGSWEAHIILPSELSSTYIAPSPVAGSLVGQA